MIASPSFTNLYGYAADHFNRLRAQARMASLLTKALGRNRALQVLLDRASVDLQNKRYMGIHNIPTDRIVGTLGRNADFDGNFRPLKGHLRDRWVNAFIRLGSDGWAPIVVHKVGETYYVEDGHHRVSVARFEGMMFIEAEVWDHPCRTVQPCICRSMGRMAGTPVGVCAAD